MSHHPQSSYRPDIDGLRTVAVALVVAFHAFPSLVPGGFVGVDVFFVISGYLISQIIVREAQAGPFSFLNFYARRFRRILPALVTVLIAVWIFGWFALLSDEYRNLAKHLGAGATFLSNFLLFREVGYFDLSVEYKPLLHLWSLSVEEQFYLFYPLLLVVLIHTRRHLVGWLAAIAGVSLIFNLVYIHFNPSFVFYFLPTRLWELLIGGLLAVCPPLITKDKSKNVLTIFGLILIFTSAFIFRSSMLYPDWRAMLPTIGTALCIAAGSTAWVNRLVLGSRPFVVLGKISYPLYLWHWPLLSFAFIAQDGKPSAELRILAVVLSLILAFLTWSLVERKIQRFQLSPKLPLRSKKFLWGGVAALAFVFVLGVHTISNRGFTWRHPAMEPDIFTFDLKATDCSKKYGTGDAFCKQSNDQPEFALIGDSLAEKFFLGLMAKDSPVGRSAILLGNNSCPYLTDVRVEVTPTCGKTIAKVDEILAATASIKTVVLILRGPRYLIEDSSYDVPFFSQPNWNMYGTSPDLQNATVEVLLEQGLKRTIAKLERHGKNVVLFIAWPEFNFNVQNCLNVRPLRFENQDYKPVCGMSVVDVQKRQEGFRAIVESLRKDHPKLRIFDPNPLLCDESYCWAAQGRRLLYLDGSHLNISGVQVVAPEFVRFLGRE